MSDRRLPAIHGSVSIHLLDSSQGHTLQTQRIAERSTITIGRNDDNDLAVMGATLANAGVNPITREQAIEP